MPKKSIFVIPLRHQWSAQFSNDMIALSQPVLGIKNFIGDQPNSLLRYFAETETLKPSDWPVVFFGPTGTGKTSLAMALFDRVLSEPTPSTLETSERDDDVQVPVFISASDFVRRFRTAVETDSVTELRNKLSAGLFIDSLQYLAGHPAAQHELCFLIDQYAEKELPFIATMPLSPNGLSDIGNDRFRPQLISRLTGGLCIRVHPPGEDARRVLIPEYAESLGMHFASETLDWLVQKLNVTVPKITHVLMQFRMSLDPSLLGQPVTLERMTQWFQKANEGSEIRRIRQITKVVANEFGFTVADLKGTSRKQTLSMARSIAIYLCRHLVGVSFLKIGNIFGNRDHSTIMHSCQKVTKLLNSPDRVEAKLVKRIQSRLAEQFVDLPYEPVENL